MAWESPPPSAFSSAPSAPELSSCLAAAACFWRASLRAPPGGAGWIGGAGGGITVLCGAIDSVGAWRLSWSAVGAAVPGGGGGAGGGGGVVLTAVDWIGGGGGP